MSGKDQLYELIHKFLSQLSRKPQYSIFATMPNKATQFGMAFYSTFKNPLTLNSIKARLFKHSFNELSQVIGELNELVANFRSLYTKKSQGYESLQNLENEIDDLIKQNDLQQILDSQAKGKSKEFKRSMERFIANKEKEEQKKQDKKESKSRATSKKSKKGKKFQPNISSRELKEADKYAKEIGNELANIIQRFNDAADHGKLKDMMTEINSAGDKRFHKKTFQDEFLYRINYSGLNKKQRNMLLDYSHEDQKEQDD